MLWHFKLSSTRVDVEHMKAFSMDLQDRVIRTCEKGDRTQAVIAEDFEVSHRYVKRPFQQ